MKSKELALPEREPGGQPQPDHKRSVVLAVDMAILKCLENKALLSPCKCDLLEVLPLCRTLGKPMDIQFMKLYSTVLYN